MAKDISLKEKNNKSERKINPWAWIPSLYFIEGLPNVIVSVLAVIIFSKMGMSDAESTFYASVIYLPYFIKPLWSPFIDIFKKKRWWIVTLQMVLGIGCALLAVLFTSSFLISAAMVVFILMAFASATHDIAADGFYILALDSNKQSVFVGIRSAFYRLAVLFGKGAVVILAGLLEEYIGDVPKAWQITFFVVAILFFCASLFHSAVLPHPDDDRGEKHRTPAEIGREFIGTFISFFRKPGIIVAMLFILFYRFPEALIEKVMQLFMLAPHSEGGLEMTTAQLGMTYGLWGAISLVAGGIIGGLAISVYGLKKMLKPMAISMSLTCIVFLILSSLDSPSLYLINFCVIIEQFGYGFGFSAYMLYLLYFAKGNSSTSHYAICTGFMALGLMFPGFFAGYIKDIIGYQSFFLLTIISCVITLLVASLVKVDAQFGKKEKEEK